MTETETQKLKEKIKNSMVEYLTKLGWPNIPDQTVIDHLKPLWVKLEEEGLIATGMNFAAFQEKAHAMAMMKQFKGFFDI